MRKEMRPPWLSADGYLIPEKLPIESTLARTLSEDAQERSDAIRVLGMMQQHGRLEAGIFLLGLLASAPDDWAWRRELVEMLDRFHTPGCAQYLFGELKRVKGSNTTRLYLGEVLKVLSGFPPELAAAPLVELAADPSFTYRMREKFEWALEQVLGRRGD